MNVFLHGSPTALPSLLPCFHKITIWRQLSEVTGLPPERRLLWPQLLSLDILNAAKLMSPDYSWLNVEGMALGVNAPSESIQAHSVKGDPSAVPAHMWWRLHCQLVTCQGRSLAVAAFVKVPQATTLTSLLSQSSIPSKYRQHCQATIFIQRRLLSRPSWRCRQTHPVLTPPPSNQNNTPSNRAIANCSKFARLKHCQHLQARGLTHVTIVLF